MGSERDIKPGDALRAAKLAVFNQWDYIADHDRRWALLTELVHAAKQQLVADMAAAVKADLTVDT